MSTLSLSRIALAAATLYAAGACAADPGAPQFAFNGFGTLGVVHSSEDQADFTSGFFKPEGAGHSQTWSAASDSLLAVQANADLTSRLSGVLQIISEQNYDNSYRPHVEWANIKYQFTPDFSVRAGRSVTSTFLLSGARKVAYTYPWVRPPLEVYSLSPLTNIDGLDILYRLHAGDLTNTVQVNIGGKDINLTNNAGVAKLRNMRGISNTTEYGPLTAHISYQKVFATTPTLNAFFDAFRQYGPQGIAIADQYEADHKPITVVGVGANYDPGHWFVMGEWGHRHSQIYLGNRTAWYASGGYRFEKFTPYVSYARARANKLSDPGLTLSALPAFLVKPAAGLNATLNSLLSRKIVQNTLSIGGRWDFVENVGLKLQFDRTHIGAGSVGVLNNIQPGFQSGGKFNLLSVSIDFVF